MSIFCLKKKKITFSVYINIIVTNFDFEVQSTTFKKNEYKGALELNVWLIFSFTTE